MSPKTYAPSKNSLFPLSKNKFPLTKLLLHLHLAHRPAREERKVKEGWKRRREEEKKWEEGEGRRKREENRETAGGKKVYRYTGGYMGSSSGEKEREERRMS